LPIGLIETFNGKEAEMPAKKYIVELTTEERSQLNAIVHADRMAAHKGLLPKSAALTGMI